MQQGASNKCSGELPLERVKIKGNHVDLHGEEQVASCCG
jgi:hypothetical protein